MITQSMRLSDDILRWVMKMENVYFFIFSPCDLPPHERIRSKKKKTQSKHKKRE